MVKLVDILNKDIGSIATKVFKADVGDMVKGASRALNTDVSTFAKGASKVLRYDLSDLFASNETNSDSNNNSSAVYTSELGSTSTGTEASTGSVAAADASINAPSATRAAQTSPVNDAAIDGPRNADGKKAAATAPPSVTDPTKGAPKAKLTEALVNRQQHLTPSGSALSVLMPLKIGGFTRAVNAATGDIANDPVSVTYSSDVEALSLTLDACWDSDEALAKLNRRRNALDNARSDASNTWVAGINGQGVVFTWRREQYLFEIVSPRGVSPVARFLADFPY